MADQVEGSRTSPVKFIDQGDGSVAERLSIAEAGAAGNSSPALATNASGIIGWLRKLVDVLTGTLLVGSGLVMGDSGRKTSTTVGTAVALTSTAAKFVRVTALLTNTQQVNVGGALASAVAGATAGDPLLPGDSTTYVVTNLNQVLLDVRVSGEGVSYTYWT